MLYRQVRTGLNGRPFTVYKFRSMRADAEAGTGAVWASKEDPRVTRGGKDHPQDPFRRIAAAFQRAERRDVDGGSPAGAPGVCEDAHAKEFRTTGQRHCILPGITGWAQINYKYGDTLEDTVTKLEYDLYYIKHMTLGLDLYIIFHTVKAMLLSRGSQ